MSSMSAPTASARFPTALMNEIFKARKAFDACLMISALCAEVTTDPRRPRRAEHIPGKRIRLVVIAAEVSGS